MEGRRRLDAGQYLAALNLYREVVTLWPDMFEGYEGMGSAYTGMGLVPEAARERQIGNSMARLAKDPDDLQARVDLADALMEKEMFSKAAAHMDRAVKLAPRNREILQKAIAAFLKNRNFNRASRAQEEMVRQEPLKPEHYEGLASSLASLGLAQQAGKMNSIGEALRAVQRDPSSSEVVDRAMRQFIAAGKRNQARDLVEQCLGMHPETSGLLRLMGEMLVDEHQNRDAIAHLKQAVKLDPIDIKAHTLLGKAYQAEGEHDQADKHLSLVANLEAARKSSDPQEAEAMLVRVLLEGGDLQRAQEQAEALAQAYPKDWRGPLVKGLVLRRQEKTKEAMEALRLSLSINPSAPEPLLEMAYILSDAGEVLESVGLARKAVNLDPRNPELRKAMAHLLRTHGYIDQAVEEEDLAEAMNKK